MNRAGDGDRTASRAGDGNRTANGAGDLDRGASRDRTAIQVEVGHGVGTAGRSGAGAPDAGRAAEPEEARDQARATDPEAGPAPGPEEARDRAGGTGLAGGPRRSGGGDRVANRAGDGDRAVGRARGADQTANRSGGGGQTSSRTRGGDETAGRAWGGERVVSRGRGVEGVVSRGRGVEGVLSRDPAANHVEVGHKGGAAGRAGTRDPAAGRAPKPEEARDRAGTRDPEAGPAPEPEGARGQARTTDPEAGPAPESEGVREQHGGTGPAGGVARVGGEVSVMGRGVREWAALREKGLYITDIPPGLSARVPAEQRGPGLGRDSVRLLVSRGSSDVSLHTFRELPGLLRAGDVLVVNTSATLPAAVDARLGGEEIVVHFSTRGPDGRWAVELRDRDEGWDQYGGWDQHGGWGGDQTWDRDQALERERGRDRLPDQDQDRGRRRDPEHSQDRCRDQDRHRDRDPGHGQDRCRDQDRHGERDRDPDQDPGRDRDQDRHGDRDRHGERDRRPGRGWRWGGWGTTRARGGGSVGGVVELPGGGRLVLEEPVAVGAGRLWWARGLLPEGARAGGMVALMHAYGRPIRYGYTERDQPLSAYQTVFAVPGPDGAGSAEMPSAGRPFTAELVAELVRRGVRIAPLTLHTGVASQEAHEPPYPEPYEVPEATARLVNAARAARRAEAARSTSSTGGARKTSSAGGARTASADDGAPRASADGRAPRGSADGTALKASADGTAPKASAGRARTASAGGTACRASAGSDGSAGGGRVIAVGTTVVRALESAADGGGVVRAGSGWTGLVVTPERGVRVVDGLLTGLHEPGASHLLMLEAVAGREAVRRGYAEAAARLCLWHEFGDVHLLLKDESGDTLDC